MRVSFYTSRSWIKNNYDVDVKILLILHLGMQRCKPKSLSHNVLEAVSSEKISEHVLVLDRIPRNRLLQPPF
jgi:hypothetical protein